MSHHRLALLAVLAAGCADPARSEPSWLTLSAAPGTRELALEGQGDRLAADRVRVSRDGEPYLTTTIPRASWTFDAGRMGGVWVTRQALIGLGSASEGLPAQKLRGGGVEYVHAPPDELRRAWELGEGAFHAGADEVVLRLPAGAEPPDGLALSVYGAHGGREGDRLRVRGRRFSGDGFALWPGTAAEVPVRIAGGSALTFLTAAEPATTRSPAEPLVYRVRLDGDVIFEHEERRLDIPVGVPHRVALPASAPSAGVLRFEVEGPASYASFLAPTLGPADVGQYAQRPYPVERPDVVVFLADTFRADNLAAYGGDPELTPFLNAFAERCAVYENSWSTGTFTLPAHISMFAGVYPRQAGIVGTGRALPDPWVTLAEELTERGYRTGAITDSGIVTEQFGLDQGFTWWDELGADLNSTLARVRTFLEADDGRPVFLFVQTYRTHIPYRVSDRTRRELGDRYDLSVPWEEVNERVQVLSSGSTDGPDDPDLRAEWDLARQRLHDLYRATARDLDRGFERFCGDLRRVGLGDAPLLFTSDHGEAFLDHDVLYHTGKVWEELARVPLLIHGGGAEPGRVERKASLVDLAPTVAELAGFEPPPAWLGRSLLAEGEERAVYVFESRRRDDSTLAVVEGTRKVMGYEDPDRLAARELAGAFELDRDPAEMKDLAGEDPAWARELLGRHTEILMRLLIPLIDPADARLDAAKERQLEQIGYADE